ncbi:hypothetical protein HYDPIDRAFT_34159 [Hydnomerulius pinastri MD-312]|uniref:Uncharacterized protein n=1 Tax=Hydnomerulius pinastri MD-312 TaxID=994086 RepID=A0A0C9VLG3_9AGAM|nr:hypothetical protein HYDPIDRAFT_34159 [Hydnomerulius pinastri MD-312]
MMEIRDDVGRMMVEVPYKPNDLANKRREDLVDMVQRQIDRWPYHEGKKKFTSKTNMTQMRNVLLNPTFGFTKQTDATAPPAEQEKDLRGDMQHVGSMSADARAQGSDRSARDNASRGSTPKSDVPDEDVLVNVYVSFVHPRAETTRKALSIRLTQVGAMNGLTGEWQASPIYILELRDT